MIIYTGNNCTKNTYIRIIYTNNAYIKNIYTKIA